MLQPRPAGAGRSFDSPPSPSSSASNSSSGHPAAAATAAAATGAVKGGDAWTAVPEHPLIRDGRRGSAATTQSALSAGSSSSYTAAKPLAERRGSTKSQSQAQADDGSDDLPTAEQLRQANKVQVRDHKGHSIPFGEIRKRGKGKTLLLFVRHQHCGFCRLFLMGLCDNPAFRQLAKRQQDGDEDAPQVVIISQGSWRGLERYADFTGPLDPATGKNVRNPFPIYSSSDSKLFKALGVTKYSLAQGKEEEVAKEVRELSVFKVVVESLGETLGSGIRGMLTGGDFSLLGADFVLEAGESLAIRCSASPR